MEEDNDGDGDNEKHKVRKFVKVVVTTKLELEKQALLRGPLASSLDLMADTASWRGGSLEKE